MADTILGEFTEMNCSDCGKKGCTYRHWGPLAPAGTVMTVCIACWNDRVTYYEQHGTAKPVASQEKSKP